jgi:hypothetical protein
VVGGCTGPNPPETDAGRRAVRDASLTGAGGTAGAGGAGQGGVDSGGMDVGRAGTNGGGAGMAGRPPPLTDAATVDGGCELECMQPGGQYCGRIESNCPRIYQDCPRCQREGFTCGGAFIHGICGAPRDGSVCKPIDCNPPGGQYCGQIGGGCGDFLFCPPCPAGLVCGGAGTPNVCGPSDCLPIRCQSPSATYCGVIGDGCAAVLDCGSCPEGWRCGDTVEHLCSPPCDLCARIARCDGGATIVSGIAVTAARANPDPLSGAIVYVPNIAPGATLPPLAVGPTCRACTSLTYETAIASAVTGPDGRFSLRNAPAGTGIPLVVQLGSWRMQTTIDVTPCVDNVLPIGSVRLPRNQREGDIPLTAISTGQHDPVECLLRKMGIDDAEFTNPENDGRIHLYRSNGATIDASTPDESVLKGVSAGSGRWSNYSQVVLPCEGSENLESVETLGNFAEYVKRGGRVLATHFSYTWLFRNGPFANIGAWTPGNPNPPAPLATDVVTSSPRGADFAAWLAHTGALSRPAPPQLLVPAPHADLGPLATGAGADLWLSSFSPPTSQIVSIDTPVPSSPDDACGLVLFSDFHAEPAASQSNTFPAECEPSAALSAAEKALEYILLYLGACASPQVQLPRPPPPPPPPPPPLPPPVPRPALGDAGLDLNVR